MQFLIPLVFLLLQIVDAKHLNERSADEIHKCEYNGVTYNEGEPLPTHHMCLDCICTKDFTEPNDRQCQVIKCPVTNHLEMGCLPVYNDTECCPGSWKCKSAEEIAKCDDRYFKHYKVKNCIPKFEENSDCPVRFSCPKDQETTVYQNECEYHGRLYKLGEEIPTSNPCAICSCRQDFATGNDISCIYAECGYRPRLNNSCYEVNELDKCCSVGTICDKEDNQPEQNKVTCDYGGKTYHEGEKIYPKENPCLICLCTESWTGILGNSCRVHDCNLEIRRRQLQQGCLPIYHESTCCPIEFFCGTPSENYVNTTVPYANNDDIESGNSCTFKGDHYKVGQVLDIRHPTNCVTCTCTTPPDFTCIHKQCPGPPNYDYANCYPTYSPGQCCPTYDCRPGSAHSVPQCSPVQCPSGCSEVTVDNSCPFCKCEERLCSPPKCPAGCEVEKDGPADRCPGCVCPDNIKVETKCGTEDISCPGFCVRVSDPFGCPLCMCGALCSPPKCGPGCELKRDVGKGECPRCACPDVPEAVTLQCSPVKCPPMCREIKSSSGCPSCECQPLCSPPKCNAGCHVEPPKTPLSCPECVCDDQESEIKGKAQCAPVKCGPLCHEAFDGNGCPTCICDLACSPAKCGEECHLDYDPVISPCPVCVCDAVSADSQCPNMTCGSMCHTKLGSDGCPTCVCDPLCSAPKCGDGCHLEYDRSAGPCPACVCLATSGLHCSPVKCEAGCVEAIGESGCPTCVCNPQCAPVKCDIGCEVHYNPITDLCPSCKCDMTDEVNPIFPCSPPKCDEGCTVDYTAYPCPICACDDASKDLSAVLCSPLKCSTGCRIDYSTKPCPSCSCPSRRFYSPLRRVQCSPPKCDLGCRINYNAKPCPSCDCSENSLLCSPPKCNPGCSIDAEAKPCPTCVCNTDKTETSGIPDIMCSPPLCDAGCRIDFTTKPCPACTCDSVFTGVQCSPPKCDASCPIDYSAKPCPSCSCGGGSSQLPTLMCSPPRCESGCRLDYTTKPCPACVCAGTPTLQCSQPKCNPDCQIDYNTKPCPSCSCGKQAQSVVSSIQCSPPKCDLGCQIDYSTKPCPSCSCSNSGIPTLQCSQPKCNPGCQIDYNSKPCPSCSCGNQVQSVVSSIQCSPPKCDPGCQIDYSTKPCPSCSCSNSGFIPMIQCSPPKCEIGCIIDFSSKPCPTCSCNKDFIGVPTLQCSPPKCDPGCQLNYSTKPCPSCSCGEQDLPTLQCSPPKCEPGCNIDYTTKPCPSCYCEPQCSIPKCAPGCRLDFNSNRCAVCVCDRYQRKFATMPFNVFRDPFCATLSCGPGCERARSLSSPNQRCPMCTCRGATGEGTKSCAAMRCELPCQWKRFSEHACPSCICSTFSF